VLSTIPVIILSQLAFAILILFFQQKNQYSSRILIVLLLCLGLWIGDIFLRISNTFKSNPALYFVPIYYSLGFGPLIFFYLKAVTNKHFKLQSRDFLHFIPVTLQFLFYLICFLLPYSTKRSFWINVHSPFTYDLEIILVQISLVVYLILAIKYFRGYKKYLINDFSETSKINLNWLRVILISLLFLTSIWLIDFLAWVLFHQERIYSILEILIATIGLVLAFGGILQSNLSQVEYKGAPEVKKTKHDFKVQPLITEAILTEMEINKSYLNPELTLNEFAKTLGIPKRTVSNHINYDLDTTFIDFVNNYRVKEVIEKFKNKEHKRLTMLGIGLSCGFNSKTTFNRIFKKYKGVSPSNYLKNIT